jgi:hypothetical protein
MTLSNKGSGHWTRRWVKLWVNEWLDGTTRYEMSGAQRAFWVDLLAMAGRSRCAGIVCAGQDGERFVGYPLTVFGALDAANEIDIPATFDLFERTGKIRIEVTSENPTKLYKITIINWDRYQSEYDRQKNYRKGYKRTQDKVTREVTTKNTDWLQVELQSTLLREGEREGERTRTCANADGPHHCDDAISHPQSDLNQTISRVWDYYLRKLQKNSKLLSFSRLRQQKGLARLNECLKKTGGDLQKAEALMKLAVDVLADSDFHRGANDRKKAYDSWERHLFPTQEKFEWWLEQAQ